MSKSAPRNQASGFRANAALSFSLSALVTPASQSSMIRAIITERTHRNPQKTAGICAGGILRGNVEPLLQPQGLELVISELVHMSLQNRLSNCL